MRVTKKQEHAMEILFWIVVALVSLALAALAHCAETRQATPVANGGRMSSSVTPDGKLFIETWADGTVTTNPVRTVQTPLSALPAIESALQRRMIVDAALARVDAIGADDTTKLQLAAEAARATLRTTALDARPGNSDPTPTPEDANEANPITQEPREQDRNQGRD